MSENNQQSTNGEHPRVTFQPQCEKCKGYDTVTVKTQPMPDQRKGDFIMKMQMRYRQCRDCGHITKCPHVKQTVRPDPPRVTGAWAEKSEQSV